MPPPDSEAPTRTALVCVQHTKRLFFRVPTLFLLMFSTTQTIQKGRFLCIGCPCGVYFAPRDTPSWAFQICLWTFSPRPEIVRLVFPLLNYPDSTLFYATRVRGAVHRLKNYDPLLPVRNGKYHIPTESFSVERIISTIISAYNSFRAATLTTYDW